jgi:transposase
MIKWLEIYSNPIIMTNNYLTMTQKELNANTVMDKLIKKELSVAEAAKIINKTERHVKRLKRKYKNEWSKGLIHKARWKPSNHQLDSEKYENAIQIIKDKYSDYWPTLSAEKLLENHSITVSISTLRRQMIEHKIWKAKKHKKVKQFFARDRKHNYWEMVQYDWSYHLWFEWRNWTEYQCLLVAIDDATWVVTAKFALNEWLVETFKFWKEYIEMNWKPQSIYLDKFATYKVNYPNATDDKQLPTQFWNTCNSLDIKLIFANTPQAKGRVERMNKTLQDRLVKALREEDISDIESANKYLNEVFLPKFNEKFKYEAKNNNDLHLPLRKDEIEKLDQYFSRKTERVINNDFCIKFNHNFYQLFRTRKSKYIIRPSYSVIVEEHLNWDIKISKLWEYIHFEKSFDRSERESKLLTAPVKENNLSLHFQNNNTIKNNLNIETDDPYYKKIEIST